MLFILLMWKKVISVWVLKKLRNIDDRGDITDDFIENYIATYKKKMINFGRVF